MNAGTTLDPGNSGGDGDILMSIFRRAELVLVKKLSNNDRDWANYRNKHQSGVYVPHEERDIGFFPPLVAKTRERDDADEIREAHFGTLWPQLGDAKRRTRLVHYTSKGQETHLTGLPKACFEDLLPASYLVVGRVRSGEETVYECMTIDSGSEEASLLADIVDLPTDFLAGVFDPAAIDAQEHDRILEFAERVIAAWLRGNIASFAHENAMPSTVELAQMARRSFLDAHGLERLNPFELPNPGDVMREISRSIEWNLFREYQRRERSVGLVQLVLGQEPAALAAPDIIRRLIDQFSGIDALMLSASQQRKSRAGQSYELHIEAMLVGGDVPFEKQVVIEARKRPDFVLPSMAFINSAQDGSSTGLILSAKTTLRERWKQVEREKGNRRLFLTTVDENVAANAIDDMASFGVCLVVPESLLKSKETEYEGRKNVISFADFCQTHVATHLQEWRLGRAG